MADTVTAVCGVTCRITRTHDWASDLAPNPSTTSDLGSSTTTLNASTSGSPVTAEWSGTVTLSAGAATLDCTALPDPVTGGSNTRNFSGLKIQVLRIKPRSTNTAAVVIGSGASNGLNVFGNSGTITLTAGADVFLRNPEGTPDVGSSAKTIDLSSSDEDAIVDIQLAAG